MFGMNNNPKNAEIVIYRLYPREPTHKGTWYYTFICKGCSNPIYPLVDNSKGTVTPPDFGDAIVRVPCPRCLHDNEYPFKDAKVQESKENVDGFMPPRVAVSKSSRKPLLQQFKSANPIMGVGLIEDRPIAAAIVGRIIKAWADIEVQCAQLLAKLMGTNVPAAAAVFGALRSSRTQAEAIGAAAQAVLDADDHLLFAAHMARKASLEKERNDLGSGLID